MMRWWLYGQSFKGSEINKQTNKQYVENHQNLDSLLERKGLEMMLGLYPLVT